MEASLGKRTQLINSMHIHRVWAQQEYDLYHYYAVSDKIMDTNGHIVDFDSFLTSRCITHMFKFYLLIYELQLSIGKNYKAQYKQIIDSCDFNDNADQSDFISTLKDARDFVTHSNRKYLDERFWGMLINPEHQHFATVLFDKIKQFIDSERNKNTQDGGISL